MYWLCVLAVIMELALNLQHSHTKQRGNQTESNRTSEKIKMVPQAWLSSRRIERLQSGILTEKTRFLLYNVGDGTLLTYKAVKVSDCVYRTESVTSNNELFRPNNFLLVSTQQNLKFFNAVVWKATPKGPTVLIEPAPPWELLKANPKAKIDRPNNDNQKKLPMSPSQKSPGAATTTMAKKSPISTQKSPFTRWPASNNQYYEIPKKEGLKTAQSNQLYNYGTSSNLKVQSRKQDIALKGSNRVGCPSIEWSFVWGVVSSPSAANSSKHRWYQIRNFNGNCLKTGATFVPCKLPNSLVIFEILKLV